jgi:hypothetical protein
MTKMKLDKLLTNCLLVLKGFVLFDFCILKYKNRFQL